MRLFLLIWNVLFILATSFPSVIIVSTVRFRFCFDRSFHTPSACCLLFGQELCSLSCAYFCRVLFLSFHDFISSNNNGCKNIEYCQRDFFRRSMSGITRKWRVLEYIWQNTVSVLTLIIALSISTIWNKSQSHHPTLRMFSYAQSIINHLSLCSWNSSTYEGFYVNQCSEQMLLRNDISTDQLPWTYLFEQGFDITEMMQTSLNTAYFSFLRLTIEQRRICLTIFLFFRLKTKTSVNFVFDIFYLTNTTRLSNEYVHSDTNWRLIVDPRKIFIEKLNRQW